MRAFPATGPKHALTGTFQSVVWYFDGQRLVLAWHRPSNYERKR